jgi:hypothetical protein
LFAKRLKNNRARQQRGHQMTREAAGEEKFLGAKRSRIPFRQRWVFRNEGWLAALSYNEILRRED